MMPSALWEVFSSDPKCLALVGVELACSTSMAPLMQFLDPILAHISLSGKKHLGPFGGQHVRAGQQTMTWASSPGGPFSGQPSQT